VGTAQAAQGAAQGLLGDRSGCSDSSGELAEPRMI
jgi:hypothetical protein